MTRFDFHIMGRLLKSFVIFVGALIVFFIVLHWVEYSDDFLDGGATASEIFLTYYPNYIPEIIRLTSPLALFLSCIYLTGKLAQELQLVALQTSGVSLYRLLKPYAVVGLAVTGFMFWFNGWIVPKTNAVVLEYDTEYLNVRVANADVSDLQRQNGPDTIISVGYYDQRDSVAHRVSLQRFTEEAILDARIDAQQMAWVDSLGRWRMEEVVRREFVDGELSFQEEMASLDTTLYIYPRDFARTERDAEAMTIPEAADFVDALRRTGANDIGRPLVAYYTKYSYPIANLILVLLAVPIASVRRRGGQAVQFGIGLLIAFAYLAIQKLAEPFGYSGALDPMLTAWLPHVVFGGIVLAVLIYTRK